MLLSLKYVATQYTPNPHIRYVALGYYYEKFINAKSPLARYMMVPDYSNPSMVNIPCNVINTHYTIIE